MLVTGKIFKVKQKISIWHEGYKKTKLPRRQTQEEYLETKEGKEGRKEGMKEEEERKEGVWRKTTYSPSH